MSSSMETELLKSGEVGEHTTWKERETLYWEEKAKRCPGRKLVYQSLYCKITGEPCEMRLCVPGHWGR